jgi:hypothetical protein
MAEVINLRRVRKARKRTENDREAAARRRLFGRTKVQKQAETTERERAERAIEAHRLDRDET